MRRLLATLVLLVSGAAAAAPGGGGGVGGGSGKIAPKLVVQEQVLPNGLRVLVHEDHTAPVVAVQVWYHVGSKNEVPGKRGLAHLFEHLMFKGTANTAPEEFSARLDAVGGGDNAFTSEDVTAYHELVPREYLDLALWLEADRMRGLKLSEETIRTEREVVKEEVRLRLENDPFGRTFEAFLALAWTKHPYAWTPAGTLDDLDAITLADAQAFYDRWYQPSNAVVVIVGDVKAKDAFASARKHFAKVPAGKRPAAEIPAEPPQEALRAETLRFDTQLPVVIGGYKVPALAHEDTPALEVLGRILSDGQASRLHRSLVRDQELAVFAGGGADGSEDPGLFLVFAAFLPGVEPGRVKDALLREVERVAAGGVAAAELAKAKNQLTAGYVFGLDRVEGKAFALGNAELLEGGWERFLEGAARYDAVTAEDVQTAAKKYLVRERLTLVTLLPPEADAPPSRKEAP